MTIARRRPSQSATARGAREESEPRQRCIQGVQVTQKMGNAGIPKPGAAVKSGKTVI